MSVRTKKTIWNIFISLIFSFVLSISFIAFTSMGLCGQNFKFSRAFQLCPGHLDRLTSSKEIYIFMKMVPCNAVVQVLWLLIGIKILGIFAFEKRNIKTNISRGFKNFVDFKNPWSCPFDLFFNSIQNTIYLIDGFLCGGKKTEIRPSSVNQ